MSSSDLGHVFPNPFHMRQMLLLMVSWPTQEPKALGRVVAHYSRNLGSPEVIYCREGLPGHGQSRRTFKGLSLCTQLWGLDRSCTTAAALPSQVIMPGGWKCCTAISTGEHLRKAHPN